jgi:hypothetical protein
LSLSIAINSNLRWNPVWIGWPSYGKGEDCNVDEAMIESP